MKNLKKYLSVSPEVQKALDEKRPVVVLESTIISHGMPYPQNKETALKVEEIVRENGAVPATIAILNGQLRVGLTEEEIDFLAKTGLKAMKVSRRDIPIALARKEVGATTVAATMLVAALAGADIFATGGIGGVHRGAELTMDISADLEELAQTSVLVVCAGAKSILDLGLTKEYLETKGVPLIGYKTDVLPAFFTRESEFGIDYRMDTAKEIAVAFAIKREMGLMGGMVVANPISKEASLDAGLINSTIEKAVAEAAEQGVKGKNITPYLLDAIQKKTQGSSLKANIALVYSNAKLASQIAVERCKL